MLVSGGKKPPSLTEAIIEFNESGLDASVTESFQMAMLRLVLVTVMLEEQINSCVGNLPPEVAGAGGSEWDRVRTSVQYSLAKVK